MRQSFHKIETDLSQKDNRLGNFIDSDLLLKSYSYPQSQNNQHQPNTQPLSNAQANFIKDLYHYLSFELATFEENNRKKKIQITNEMLQSELEALKARILNRAKKELEAINANLIEEAKETLRKEKA